MPHWIVQAIRSTPAEAIAGEAAMEVEVAAAMEVGAATGVAEVINAARLRRVLICRNSDFLDSF